MTESRSQATRAKGAGTIRIVRQQVHRPRLTRAILAESASNWNSVGVVFLILAAAGAIVLGIGVGTTTERNSGAGIAIGVGTFVGSLVVILPYFMFGRVMSALADLLPDTASADLGFDAPTDAGVPSEDLSDGTDYSDVAAAHPSAYQAALEQLMARNPQPERPNAWLRELCRRIEAGSPAEAAAQRIPLDWV